MKTAPSEPIATDRTMYPTFATRMGAIERDFTEKRLLSGGPAGAYPPSPVSVSQYTARAQKRK